MRIALLLALATTTAGLAVAAPAVAQTRADDARFATAQDRMDRELALFRAESDRYRAARNNNRGGYRDQNYNNGQYNNGQYNNGRGFNGNPRQAVQMCIRTAERLASRHSYGNADVTDIRDVRRTGGGFEVRGRIAVNAHGRDWRGGDNQYGRGWSGDYRGWDNSHRGYDSGRFTCRVERGRVADIDFDGVRGL